MTIDVTNATKKLKISERFKENLSLLTEIEDNAIHFINASKFFEKKGFRNIDIKQKEEEIIREKTIGKFEYDKIVFWISISAVIIAGLTLFIVYFSKPVVHLG